MGGGFVGCGGRVGGWCGWGVGWGGGVARVANVCLYVHVLVLRVFVSRFRRLMRFGIEQLVVL